MASEHEPKIFHHCFLKPLIFKNNLKFSEMVKCEIIDPQGPSPTTVANSDNHAAAESFALPECPNTQKTIHEPALIETMTISEVTESEIKDMLI